MRPEDVRDFAIEHCPALDFFLLDGRTAISCANSSRVSGTSRRSLLSKLDAVQFWSKGKGFIDVDIDWDFTVIKRLNPPMTSLISTVPYPSKAVHSLELPTPEPRETPSFGKRLHDHPLVVAVSVAALAAATTFAIIREVRVVPLEERIEWLEQRIDSLEGRKEPAATLPIDPSQPDTSVTQSPNEDAS